jgi:hypothetical protein
MARSSGTPSSARAPSGARTGASRVAPARAPAARALAPLSATAAPAAAPANAMRCIPVAGPAAGEQAGGGAEGTGGRVRSAVRRLNGGAPLPPGTRERMEQGFGRTFEDVRIHTDAAGGELAQHVGAEAVTIGNRVAFAPGMFRPGTATGEHVLAHELAHVAQHDARGGGGAEAGMAEMTDMAGEGAGAADSAVPLQARLAHSQPSEPAEVAAEHAATAVSRGDTVRVSPAAPGGALSTRARLMRRAREGAPLLTICTPLPGTGRVGLGQPNPAPPSPGTTPAAPKPLAVAPTAAPAPAQTTAPATTALPQTTAAIANVMSAPAGAGPTAADATAARGAGPAAGMAGAAPATAEAPGAEKPAPEAAAPAPATAAAGAATKEAAKAAPVQPEVPGKEEEPAAAVQAAAAGGEKAEAGKPGEAKPGEAKPGEAKPGEAGAAGAEEPGKEAAPEVHSPRSPQEDPGFLATIGRARAVAEQQGHNNPAQRKAQEAQAAAQGPANEVASQAKAAQVGKMDAEQPAPFKADSFEAALLAKIQQLTPDTLEKAKDFKQQGKAGEIKAAVKGEVAQGKEAAGTGIQKATEGAPDPGVAKPKAVEPLPPTEAGPRPPELGADAAAPKPKTDAEVPMEREAAALDKPLADADITDEQLQKANEPTFTAAVEGKNSAQKDAKEQTEAFRAGEQSTITNAQAGAVGTAADQVGLMHGTREDQFGNVAKEQQATKGEDEGKRAEVATKIEGFYSTTKQQVEARLAQLDRDVDGMFDAGADKAKQDFESFVDKQTELFILERYTGNPLLLARDLFLGLPPEVNNIYVTGRDRYIAQMRGVIGDVARVVETGLNEAKGLIAGGLQQVNDFVASLPKDLQKVGTDAANAIQGKFDALRTQVDQHRDQLIDKLAKKYTDNLKGIDADIEKRKASNRGLVDRAAAAINEVIDTIKQLKEMLLGVLAKGAAVINQIIKDPIGFLGNLVAGIGQGLKSFIANIGTHLKQGFTEWLFGQISATGIQLPETLDLKGIFSLVAQVLGLTYANFRARAVGILGEETVARFEQVAEVFKIFITQGASGIWEFIKDKVGDLKSLVLDGIRDFVIQKVIVGGIEFLVSLLTPASAFVKAVKAIVDIVTFIVQRGSQIVALVNAVIDSLAAIASGSVGAVAAAVENALARGIPVAIGFLASLLGLGGIGDKIRSIIEKIQAPVNKAIDFLINLAVKLVKAGGKFLGGLFSGKEKKPADPKQAEETDPKKQAEVDAGLAEIDQDETRLETPDQKITKQHAEQVAATTQSHHPVFKSVAVVDDGERWDYDYEASPRKRKRGLLKEEGGIVRVDFAKFNKRLKFSDETKEILAKRFPDKHIEGTTNVKTGFDRRHTVAYSTMRDQLGAEVNGKTLQLAAEALRARNRHADENIESIEAAVGEELQFLFNNPANLFVGGAEENQALGRDIASAKRDRDKLDPAKEPEKFAEKSAALAKAEIDIGEKDKEPGKTQDQPETPADTAAIDTVTRVEGQLPKHQRVSAEADKVNKGEARPSANFLLAQADLSAINKAVRYLGENARERAPTTRDRMKASLTKGVEVARMLGEALASKT